MESKLPAPQNAPEFSALNRDVQQIEVVSRPLIEVSKEKIEPKRTYSQGVGQNAPILPVPSTPIVDPKKSKVARVTQPIVGDNPPTAKDEEIIEKEWVDKAKKIVAKTKNDPYEQEKEVGRLQADYLRKRYGKEVKVAGD